MTRESFDDRGWSDAVGQLGGAEALEKEAREAGAFTRSRAVKCAVDLLRLCLAYCTCAQGLRSTAAWAEAVGLASLSNVALLKRLRKMAPWLELIVARLITAQAASPRGTRTSEERAVLSLARGRLIRLVDATVVSKASRAERAAGGVWRVHAVFDLDGASERFSAFELTDEREGERLDRAAVVPGEIRIADRAYLQGDRMAKVMAAGADILIRAPWNGARWLDADARSFDLVATLMKARRKGVVDMPVWIKATAKEPLRVRLVAIRKPQAAIDATVEKLEAEARAKGRKLQIETIVAAGWVILVTSLPLREFPADAIGGLYRLRWRIEIGFKHLKSGVGLARPPGEDPDLAKAHILCHLLMALLAEPHLSAHLGDSPRSAARRLRQAAA